MRKITEPDWMKNMAKDGWLLACDMRRAFGYEQTTSITKLINDGLLPRPSEKKKGIRNFTLRWEVSEVRRLIKRMQGNP